MGIFDRSILPWQMLAGCCVGLAVFAAITVGLKRLIEHKRADRLRREQDADRRSRMAILQQAHGTPNPELTILFIAQKCQKMRYTNRLRVFESFMHDLSESSNLAEFVFDTYTSTCLKQAKYSAMNAREALAQMDCAKIDGRRTLDFAMNFWDEQKKLSTSLRCAAYEIENQLRGPSEIITDWNASDASDEDHGRPCAVQTSSSRDAHPSLLPFDRPDR